jgi:hypothetical protein
MFFMERLDAVEARWYQLPAMRRLQQKMISIIRLLLAFAAHPSPSTRGPAK